MLILYKQILNPIAMNVLEMGLRELLELLKNSEIEELVKSRDGKLDLTNEIYAQILDLKGTLDDYPIFMEIA
jgi:hypothetical protein